MSELMVKTGSDECSIVLVSKVFLARVSELMVKTDSDECSIVLVSKVFLTKVPSKGSR